MKKELSHYLTKCDSSSQEARRQFGIVRTRVGAAQICKILVRVAKAEQSKTARASDEQRTKTTTAMETTRSMMPRLLLVEESNNNRSS